MVDPDLPRPEYGDSVAVRFPTPSHVCGGWSDVGVPRGHAVVNVDAVDDDVAHVLQGHAAPAGDVHIGSSPVYGLEAVDDELVLEFDEHVGGEGNPQGLSLDHSVPESARSGVDGVLVGGVGDHIELTALAAHSVLAEPNAAVGEALPVVLPVGVTPPAVVNGVTGETRRPIAFLYREHLSSR